MHSSKKNRSAANPFHQSVAHHASPKGRALPAVSPFRATAPDTVIQRKVGFEFETSIPVYAGGKNIIAKNAGLYTGANGLWHITPDAGNIEFVTEPFEEEGEKPETENLVDTIGQITGFVSSLDTLNKAHTPPQDTHVEEQGSDDDYDEMFARLQALSSPPQGLPSGKDTLTPPEEEKEKTDDDYEDIFARLQALSSPSEDFPPGKGTLTPPEDNYTYLKTVEMGTAHLHQGKDVYVKKEDNIASLSSAAPQVTGGINLENVSALIEKSLTTDVLKGSIPMEESRHNNDAIFPQAIAHAGEYMRAIGQHDGIDTAKLQQLVTLIYVYLLSGQEQSGVHDQAKYAFPMMTRMNFLAIYNTLDGNTKNAFFPELILTAGGLGHNVPVYAYGFLDFKDKEARLQEIATKEFEEKSRFLATSFGKTILGRSVEALISSEAAGLPTEAFSSYLSQNKERIIAAYRKDNDDLNKQRITPERGPERLAWLTQLQQQKDLMSSAPVTSGMFASSPAMGKYNKLDNDHLERPDKLIQMELRRLKKGVPPEDWMELALNLFNMFAEVQNNLKK